MSPTPVVSAAEQKRIDQLALGAGVAEISLMKSAGESAARYVLGHVGGMSSPRAFAVIAGAGGNGGDAAVVALALLEAGHAVETYLASPPEQMTRGAGFHVGRLIERAPDHVHVLADDVSDLQDTLVAALRSTSCVIDGLFGSGIRRPATGRFEAIIDAVNQAPSTIFSLDLPSGIPADCGTLIGPAITADHTVAMHFLKPAHILYPARGLCGRIGIACVAYPEHVLAAVDPIAVVPGLETLVSFLPERPETAHKGRFGHVLVVAGSRGLTGAAILCCRAALRAGAGLVTLACPGSLEPVFETTLPEVITVPLPERDGVLVSVETARFRDVLATADALAVGPGLSRHPSLAPIVARLVTEVRVPLVLDADGLWPFGAHPERIAHAQGERILTPHPGEMSRLLDLSIEEIEDARLEIAHEAARTAQATVVLKGVPTVISAPALEPGGQTLVTLAGNHGLATGGSGDVLTGLIAGLVAQRIPPRNAACLGVYVHGASADKYAETRSARSLLPSDVIALLPEIFFDLEPSQRPRLGRKKTCG
ncbi:NAD(P)H-hydrate dehydratase [Candidatus Bipolaricaulota bacterium]|nr:NAD(P)H-hydrate dehydratase [Candidatus Bipolaricaulota bacterium]